MRLRSLASVTLLWAACGHTEGSSADLTGTDSVAATTAVAPTDGSFVVMPDAPAPECDPGQQDCPEGQKCTPYATLESCCVDSTRCAPIVGALGPAAPCTRADDNDDCGPGLLCLGAQSGGSGPGTCVALCDVEDPTTCGADRCVQFNEGALPLCRPACDPLAQDCPEGQACYAVLTEQAFTCLTSAFAPGHGGAGEPCATISACRPGLLCTVAAELEGCTAELCCTPLCPAGSDECLAPLTCEQVYDPVAYPLYAGVGYCRRFE